ncbi:hypothetical protein VE00_03339 [Pseudogymnoascus sp. WSF 3629]|nr:hypothetical protein VE00_03339 [Pseudogymnoascus sp. WSF 3629]
MAPKFNLNSRTIATPLAAFCMANLVFIYTRTSIQAAKRNAQKHRDADGDQINWRNESLRRHGVLEPPETRNSVKQLLGVGVDKVGVVKERTEGEVGRTEEEEYRIRQAVRNKGRREE